MGQQHYERSVNNTTRKEINNMKLKEYLRLAWVNAEATKRDATVLDWLDSKGIVDVNLWVYCEDTRGIHHVEDSYYCEHDEAYYASDDDFQVVMTHRGRHQNWCAYAVSNHAFYCEWSQKYFSSRDYDCVRVVDTDEWVCREWNDDNIYYWESDGEYHTDYEPEDEDEDESSDCGRSGYHSDRSTRNQWASSIPRNADVFGVELEMKANDGSDLEDICARAAGNGFISEYDGSLDERLGVEIVAPPMPLAKFRKGDWAEFMDGIRRLGTGWDAGTGYGIHISINRTTLSPIRQSMFLRFFPQNQAFCETIAGRRANHWCRYELPRWSVSKLSETDKYLAASIRSRHRIEVRIFRSTLKFHSFLKNVQFVAALVEFVRNTSPRLNTSEEFVKFASHKSRRNSYRELLGFLDEKNLNGSSPATVC
jgi:hypothetical protein